MGWLNKLQKDLSVGIWVAFGSGKLRAEIVISII